MPSKTKRPTKRSSRNKVKKDSSPVQSSVVWPLIIVSFILWLVYRSLIYLPVWFDESIGKAIFFGGATWLYITVANHAKAMEGLSISKFWPGLYLGLAIGGLYGFVANLVSLLVTQSTVLVAPLFMTPQFWGEFLLALLTGFWESLFFFGFILTALDQKYQRWAPLAVITLTAVIFTVFHVPASLINFDGVNVISLLVLWFAFGLGQGLVYWKWRNLYTLTLTHALWGMVLLIQVG